MNHERGFTLIELVIVAIIIAIVAAVITPLAVSSLRAYNDTLNDVVTLDKLRYAAERLAREIREVEYANSTIATPTKCADLTSDRYCFTPSTGMGLNTMQFTTPFTSTGLPGRRTITIGNSVVSGFLGNAVTLAYDDVTTTSTAVLTDQLQSNSALTFNYYQQDGTSAATASNVRFVKITLTLTQPNELGSALNTSAATYSQSAMVALRNR